MDNDFREYPDRLEPYILMKDLNEPITVAPSPFRLTGPHDGSLDADLVFRWVPSSGIRFDGSSSFSPAHLGTEPWTLQSDGAMKFSVPVLITHTTFGNEVSRVQGLVNGDFAVGERRFERVRFCLVNFPDYLGKPVRYEQDGRRGVAMNRLEVGSGDGSLRVDLINEVNELRERASKDPGFLISHVGDWTPISGTLTETDAQSTLYMLHFWFGFLRGAWAGPVFPEGLVNGQVVWRQFAPWKLGESREVTTWLPDRTHLDLTHGFAGFVGRWNDPAWQRALISAISWFVEANSPRSALESKVILTQVALELLAWVHLVETQRIHSRSDFKRLSAAGRIRALLHHINVSTAVPDYLPLLSALNEGDAFDGPGIITKVRNALVHATEASRSTTEALKGPQLLQCSQLALHYLELVILSVCDHRGHYARRGWRGWKGDDEVLVPWAATKNHSQ